MSDCARCSSAPVLCLCGACLARVLPHDPPWMGLYSLVNHVVFGANYDWYYAANSRSSDPKDKWENDLRDRWVAACKALDADAAFAAAVELKLRGDDDPYYVGITRRVPRRELD